MIDLRGTRARSGGIVALTLLLSGCTSTVAGSAVKASGPERADTAPAAGGCTAVSAPLSPIDAKAAGEPRLQIPQPPGWQRLTELDSDLIRYMLRNDGLAADNFAPTAVVTLETAAEPVDPERAVEMSVAALQNISTTDLKTTASTVCGYPGETARYFAPPMGPAPSREVTTLVTAARFHDTTYIVTVTVQSTQPSNAIYATDTQTILTGFQLLAPDGQ